MKNKLILALIFMAFSYPMNTQWFCYDAQFMASILHFMKISWDNHRLFMAFLSTSACARQTIIPAQHSARSGTPQICPA